MTIPRSPLARKRAARGVAAIELAILFASLSILLPGLMLFGRVFNHYSVFKAAASDAAAYMATLPQAEVRDQVARDGHILIAKSMVTNAAAQAGIKYSSENFFTAIGCNGAPSCDGIETVPRTFSANVTFRLKDAIFPDASIRWMDTSGTSMVLYANSVSPYVN